MDFDPISLSHDPLLNVPIEEINQPSQSRRYIIIISGICFIICLLLLTLTLVFIATSKQQLWSVTPNTNIMTTTSTSIRSNELKTTSKHEQRSQFDGAINFKK
jgi:amino acid transporter